MSDRLDGAIAFLSVSADPRLDLGLRAKAAEFSGYRVFL